MVQADGIPVVLSGRLRFADPKRDADPVAVEVPDRLAAFAHELRRVPIPERLEQLPVERQAAVDRGDDDVDVVHPHLWHRGSLGVAHRAGCSGCRTWTRCSRWRIASYATTNAQTALTRASAASAGTATASGVRANNATAPTVLRRKTRPVVRKSDATCPAR